MFRRVLMASMLLAGVAAQAGCSNLTADNPNTARPYLVAALKAVEQRDAPTALADIDKAESVWIGTNVPFSSPFLDFDPDAMRNMARARQSVEMRRWSDAEYYVRTALTHPSVVMPN